MISSEMILLFSNSKQNARNLINRMVQSDLTAFKNKKNKTKLFLITISVFKQSNMNKLKMNLRSAKCDIEF